MRNAINFIKDRILESGTDDWVHDTEASFAARQAMFDDRLRANFPTDSTLNPDRLASLRAAWLADQERQAFPLVLMAIKELVRDGLVEIGSIGNDGFMPWEGSLEDIEARIDRLFEVAKFPLLPGDLFWLSNTPMGDARVSESSGTSPVLDH